MAPIYNVVNHTFLGLTLSTVANLSRSRCNWLEIEIEIQCSKEQHHLSGIAISMKAWWLCCHDAEMLYFLMRVTRPCNQCLWQTFSVQSFEQKATFHFASDYGLTGKVLIQGGTKMRVHHWDKKSIWMCLKNKREEGLLKGGQSPMTSSSDLLFITWIPFSNPSRRTSFWAAWAIGGKTSHATTEPVQSCNL